MGGWTGDRGVVREKKIRGMCESRDSGRCREGGQVVKYCIDGDEVQK